MNMRNDNRRRGGGPQHDQIVAEAIRKIPDILDYDKDPTGEILIDTAQKLGEHMARVRRMSTAQIRRIFADVKKLNFNQDKGPYELNIMRAQLAYTAGRHPQVRDLQEVLDRAIVQVGSDTEKFQRFSDFFEAIVAYHKKYGGKD